MTNLPPNGNDEFPDLDPALANLDLEGLGPMDFNGIGDGLGDLGDFGDVGSNVSPSSGAEPSFDVAGDSEDPFANLPDAIDVNADDAFSGLPPAEDVASVPITAAATTAAATTAAAQIIAAPNSKSAKANPPSKPDSSRISAGSVDSSKQSAQSSVATGSSKESAKKDSASTGNAGEVTDAEPESQPRRSRRRKGWLRAVPGWMVSMMLHIAILMTLAAIQIEPVRDAIGGVLMTAAGGEDSGLLDQEFELKGPEIEEPPGAEEMQQVVSEPAQYTSQDFVLPNVSSMTDLAVNVDSGGMKNLADQIMPSSGVSASAVRLSSSLSGRGGGSMKSQLLEKFGGNAASEKSVALALQWIAAHQGPRGGWSFAHSGVCRGECKNDGELANATNGATALALLPFLGAGQTHLEGNYKSTVYNGLNYLIKQMKVTKGDLPQGSWHEPGGSMYSHGLASIVVCEAYAMTRDPDLLQPAQMALNFIVTAQDPRGGGWRYNPKQAGDTSVVGWQLMALKSGMMGNLKVPYETFGKANSFLDSISVNSGAYYGYDERTS